MGPVQSPGQSPSPVAGQPSAHTARAEKVGFVARPEAGEALVPRGRFPSAQRVCKRSEFLEIQSSGRRVSTARFVLLLRARNGPATGARLGITVSRKTGVAVARNRAKRVLREAFRATRELWPSDIDLVVIVRKLQPPLGLTDVVAEWQRADRAIRRRAAEARRDREIRASALARGG